MLSMLSSSNVNKLASEVGFNSIFSKLQMFNKRVNIQALVIETIPPKDTSSVHIKNTGDNILPVSTLMFRMYKIGIWLTPSNRHPQPFQDIIAYIYICVCIFAHEKHHMKGFREKKSCPVGHLCLSCTNTCVAMWSKTNFPSAFCHENGIWTYTWIVSIQSNGLT